MPIPQAWVIAEPWVIREVGTFNYIRGSTHEEPRPLYHGALPRLFRSERHCINFVGQWRRGMHVNYGEDGVEIRKVPKRADTKLEYLLLKLVRDPT